MQAIVLRCEYKALDYQAGDKILHLHLQDRQLLHKEWLQAKQPIPLSIGKTHRSQLQNN